MGSLRTVAGEMDGDDAMKSKTVKQCACGCPHTIRVDDEFTFDDHERKRPECKCTEYVKPSRFDRFQVQHSAALAKLNTPEEQARIAAELERIRIERERLEPLDAMLDRLGAPRKKQRKARGARA